jgi:hypothetical protein
MTAQGPGERVPYEMCKLRHVCQEISDIDMSLIAETMTWLTRLKHQDKFMLNLHIE